MSTNPIAQMMEQMVGAYFEACRKQDASAIAACFAPGGVHYFPHRPPFRGGSAIGTFIVEDLRNRGGEYFIDRIFTNVEQRAAAVEWSRTCHQSDRILRGYSFTSLARHRCSFARFESISPPRPIQTKREMRSSVLITLAEGTKLYRSGPVPRELLPSSPLSSFGPR